MEIKQWMRASRRKKANREAAGCLQKGRWGRSAAAFVIGAVVMTAQTRVDLRSQTRNADFSSGVTKPFQLGTELPAKCGAGEAFFKINAPAGQSWYGCTAPDTWTLQGPIPWKVTAALPATCTVGEMVFKTDEPAGHNLYGCTAANVWTLQTVPFNPIDSATLGQPNGTASLDADAKLSKAELPHHNHPAADIDSGVLAPGRICSGTADATNFCRGDGQWSVPAVQTVPSGVTGPHLPDLTFSGELATICATCTTTVATARFSNSVRQYSAPVDMRITGGSTDATTVRFYVDTSLNLRVQYDASVITGATLGSGLTEDTVSTSFPPASLPLYACSVANLQFTSCTDLRASGTWMPSSLNGSCTITATVSGWDFNCGGSGNSPGGALSSVTLTHEIQAAVCHWNGVAYAKDMSVVSASDPGSACFDGVGTLAFPNNSAGVWLLFSTIVPFGATGDTDVYVDVFSAFAGAVTLTIANACRAVDTQNSNYQTYDVTYGLAESRTVELVDGTLHRFSWFNKTMPTCNPGEELHWQITRDPGDANAGTVNVVRAVVVQRLN